MQDEIKKQKRELDCIVKKSDKKYLSIAEIESDRKKRYLEDMEQLKKEKQQKLSKKLEEIEEKQSRRKVQLSDTEDILPFNEREISNRLTALGQPILLFGESQKCRLERLKIFETLYEDKMDSQNILQTISLQKSDGPSFPSNFKSAMDVEAIQPSLIKEDFETVLKRMHLFFHLLLDEWKESLLELDDVKNKTPHGKLALRTVKQTEIYLKPLFQGLSAQKLDLDILTKLCEICYHMQRKAHNKANDTYMRLSIGNAPWPIGVTGVAVHERSADAKIASGEIAHVLNDETSRKWIQSVKRLMTFCEQKYPQ